MSDPANALVPNASITLTQSATGTTRETEKGVSYLKLDLKGKNDDVPYARFTIPRLTTVFANAKRGGQDAVKLLLRRLADPGRPHEAILAPTQLVIRESTGPAPG